MTAIILIEETNGKRPLGRHGRRWEYIIKWILKNVMGVE
jgi:hypothetical protein